MSKVYSWDRNWAVRLQSPASLYPAEDALSTSHETGPFTQGENGTSLTITVIS